MDINIYDSITLTDEIGYPIMLDSVTITESITTETSIADISSIETISITENSTVSLTLQVSTSDVLTITESISLLRTTFGEVDTNDTFAISESISTAISLRYRHSPRADGARGYLSRLGTLTKTDF